MEALLLLLVSCVLFVLWRRKASANSIWSDYTFEDGEAVYERNDSLSSRYQFVGEDRLPYNIEFPTNGARRRKVGHHQVVQLEDGKAFGYNGTRFPLGVVEIALRGNIPTGLRILTSSQYLDTIVHDLTSVRHYLDCCPLLVGTPVYYPEHSVQELTRSYVLMVRRRKFVPTPSWGDSLRVAEVLAALPSNTTRSIVDAISAHDWLRVNDLIRILLKGEGLDYSPQLGNGLVFLAKDGVSLGVPADAKEGTKVNKRRRMLQHQIHSTIDPCMLDFTVVPGELWETEFNPLCAVPRVAEWLASQGWNIPRGHHEDVVLKLLLGETLPSPQFNYQKVDVNKVNETARWMKGESGDKLGSIGQTTVNTEPGIHALKSILFHMDEIGLDRPPRTFIADGYKGQWKGDHLGSTVGLLNVARYANRGLRMISLAVTHGLAPWADWDARKLMQPFHDYMSGNLERSEYQRLCRFQRDGQTQSTALDACLEVASSDWVLTLKELWTGHSSLLTHAIGMLRDSLSPKRLGMYRTLCGSVGDDVDTIRVPLGEMYGRRREIAPHIAWQLGEDADRLAHLFDGMTRDAFSEWFESNQIWVILQFFPHFPGINVKLRMKLWDTQVIGLKPRLAWALMRDFDGDTVGFHLPTAQELRFSVTGDYIYRLSTNTRIIARDFMDSLVDDFRVSYEGDALDLMFESVERKYAVGMSHHYAHFNGLQWLHYTESTTRIPSPRTPVPALFRECGLAGAMFLFHTMQQTAINEKEIVRKALTHDMNMLVNVINHGLGHRMQIPRVSYRPLTRYPESFSIISRSNLGGHRADALREPGEDRSVYHVIRVAQLTEPGNCVVGFRPIHDRLCEQIAQTPMMPLTSLKMVAAVLGITPKRRRGSEYQLLPKPEELDWLLHLEDAADRMKSNPHALPHFLAGRSAVDVAMMLLLLSPEQQSELDAYFS